MFRNLLKGIDVLVIYTTVFFTDPVFLTMVQIGNTGAVIVNAIEIGLLCYIAGRLNKVKENTVIIIVLTVTYIAFFVSDVFSGTATIAAIAPLIIRLDICVAYFLRYKEHREAGLMDAPKK